MISFKPREVASPRLRGGRRTVRLDGVEMVRNSTGGGGGDVGVDLFGNPYDRRKHGDGDEESPQQPVSGNSNLQRVSMRKARRTSSYMELRRLMQTGRGRSAPVRTGSSRSDNDSVSAGSSAGVRSILLPNRITLFTSLIILVGLAASTLIFGFGIASAVDRQAREFDIHASGIISELEAAWKDYEIAGRWTHQSCRKNDFTRQEFRDLYEYLTSDGLKFQALEWLPRVSRLDRETYEADSRSYYNEDAYPDFTYNGFQGYEPNNATTETGISLQKRSEQAFYYPVHFVEPFASNQAVLDFDAYSSPRRQTAIDKCLTTYKPVVSDRLHLIEEELLKNETSSHYGVLLMHPGLPLSRQLRMKPKDISVLVVPISEVLTKSLQKAPKSISLYIYDKSANPKEPEFLGAAEAKARGSGRDAELELLPEIPRSEIIETELFIKEVTLHISSSDWTVIAVALPDTFVPNIRYVVVAGKIIIMACLCLGFWIFTNLRRNQRINELMSKAEAEKAAIIVDNAKKAAKAEHELNDYLAHEVRNPLAAAMSACSFVKAQVYEEKPLSDGEAIQSAREDVTIIESSLRFIHDLLRNMLDMHKAADKKLKLEIVPMDLEQDILKPVSAMLYQRNVPFEVIIESPKNCVVMTDRLRLKQIVLNLARNSAKFVTKGYIKLRATADGTVKIFVEDSGPGIPMEKRGSLFSKFQESLDKMDQGTGVGLCLCKSLTQLLEGSIWLDETFDSGVEGCKGTRFVVDLRIPPLQGEEYDQPAGTDKSGEITPQTNNAGKSVQIVEDAKKEENLLEEATYELPGELSVLFVDDDLVLRKLFMRSVRKVSPSWTILEAANGEAALQMVTENPRKFDLIFMDQYMASVEKQLLGTETVRELRLLGCTSRICGLSANDTEKEFLVSGADFFLFKPIPCNKEKLRQELYRLLTAETTGWVKPESEPAPESEAMSHTSHTSSHMSTNDSPVTEETAESLDV